MANTVSSRTYRDKFRSAVLEKALRGAMVASDIVTVDRSNNMRIQSPYSSAPTVTVQALAGTYSTADFTTTDDTLTVTDEFIVAEHIMDFQDSLSQFDLFADRAEKSAFAVAKKVDEFVLNNLCEDGTGTYTTPSGGFTNGANIIEIFSNLISKVSGYAEAYYGNMFLVVENTDIPGILIAAGTNGFNRADQTLSNGKVASFMGVDIYVVRTGTFSDATVGTKTWTNNNHRVFGVKGVATMALPGGYKHEEKAVSLKTGMEVVTYGYVGFKLWSQVTDLIVDITLA